MALDKKDKRPEETGTDTAGMGSATLGSYVNPYEGQIMELYKGISERKPFRYDVNEDVMYQNLRDQYIAGGQMAMMDTMGQAAQLTGGYGNSYAQGVGQQAYQGYLQGLNDQVPDLYNMALQNYIQTGDAMLQEYGMLQDMAADDYGKYRDNMALVQPQVLEMLQNGVIPSDELLKQSGLSKEYLQMLARNGLMANGGLAQQGNDGKWYVAESSKWFQGEKDAFNNDKGWLSTSDGQRWLNTREGQRWASREYENYKAEIDASGATDSDKATALDDYKKKYHLD